MRDVNHRQRSMFEENENYSNETCALSIEPQISRTIDPLPSETRSAGKSHAGNRRPASDGPLRLAGTLLPLPLREHSPGESFLLLAETVHQAGDQKKR